jgi:chromosomal replication initiator protein
LPPEEICAKNKTRTASLARHIAILLCRELLGLSLVRTGQIFAGRDHSSVLYSLKKIKRMQESNKDMYNQVEELRQLCLTDH